MSAIALNRGVRMSPRKISVVAALVRGRTVEDALTILQHTPRRSAAVVADTVKSAQANAEHNHNYKPNSLFITEISVTAGPRLKRYRKGRGYRGGMDPFQLKTSHIRVVVDGEKRVAKKPAAAKNSEKETK
jgi:large subunit ribosomal protein L22